MQNVDKLVSLPMLANVHVRHKYPLCTRWSSVFTITHFTNAHSLPHIFSSFRLCQHVTLTNECDMSHNLHKECSDVSATQDHTHRQTAAGRHKPAATLLLVMITSMCVLCAQSMCDAQLLKFS